jgi:hypothetical protein
MDYNRRLLTTVVLVLVLLIGLVGAIVFGYRQDPGWTVFFLTFFAASAGELNNYYDRAWQNNP